MRETSTTASMPSAPVSRFLGSIGVPRRRRKDEEERLTEAQPIERFSAVCGSRCRDVAKMLKRFNLGVTAKAAASVGDSILNLGKERSDYDDLHSAEHVILSAALRLLDWTTKMSKILARKDYHDFCQEIRTCYDYVQDQIDELVGEYRRSGKRKLDNPEAMELQARKYLQTVRDWSDAFTERVGNAMDRYI